MVKIGRAIPNTLCLLVAATPLLSQAGVSNMLWTPTSAVAPKITATPLSDGVYQSTVTLRAPVGYYDSKVVGSICSGSKVSRNNNSIWIMYPVSGVSETGIKWDLAMQSSGHYGPRPATETGGLSGYNVMNFSWSSRFDGNDFCLRPGEVLPGLAYPASTAPAVGMLTVEKLTAKPGHHVLTVPIYWGFEENKYDGSEGALWSNMGGLLRNTNTINATVTLDINTHCTYNTSPIQLDHGVIAPHSPNDKFDSQVYGLNVQCDHPAQVSIELKAINPISSTQPNVSKCAGGRCELTLAVDGISNVPQTSVKVEDRKTFYIKSTFMPGSKWLTGALFPKSMPLEWN